MADVSIANLPAFVGSSAANSDLLVMVDVSDTSESPLGTTKRITFTQVVNNILGGVTVEGAMNVTGNVGVGNSADAASHSLTIDAAAGRAAYVAFATAGVVKWALGRGAANGSDDFQLYNQVLGSLAVGVDISTNALTLSAPSITWAGQVLNLGTGQLTLNRSTAGPLQLAFAQGGTTRAYIINPATDSIGFYTGGGVPMLLAASSGVVIGTDPGATYPLRVGGLARFGAGGVLVDIGPAATQGLVGTNSNHPLALFTNGLNRVVIGTDGSVVIGADPGLGGILRVGGQITARTMALQENANTVSLNINNTAALSFGIHVSAGGTGGNFIASFANYLTVEKVTIDEGLGGANATALLLWANALGSQGRVFTGPVGSGPGGVGRVLYLV